MSQTLVCQVRKCKSPARMQAGSLMVCPEHHQRLSDELARRGRSLGTFQGSASRYLQSPAGSHQPTFSTP